MDQEKNKYCSTFENPKRDNDSAESDLNEREVVDNDSTSETEAGVNLNPVIVNENFDILTEYKNIEKISFVEEGKKDEKLLDPTSSDQENFNNVDGGLIFSCNEVNREYKITVQSVANPGDCVNNILKPENEYSSGCINQVDEETKVNRHDLQMHHTDVSSEVSKCDGDVNLQEDGVFKIWELDHTEGSNKGFPDNDIGCMTPEKLSKNNSSILEEFQKCDLFHKDKGPSISQFPKIESFNNFENVSITAVEGGVEQLGCSNIFKESKKSELGNVDVVYGECSVINKTVELVDLASSAVHSKQGTTVMNNSEIKNVKEDQKFVHEKDYLVDNTETCSQLLESKLGEPFENIMPEKIRETISVENKNLNNILLMQKCELIDSADKKLSVTSLQKESLVDFDVSNDETEINSIKELIGSAQSELIDKEVRESDCKILREDEKFNSCAGEVDNRSDLALLTTDNEECVNLGSIAQKVETKYISNCDKFRFKVTKATHNSDLSSYVQNPILNLDEACLNESQNSIQYNNIELINSNETVLEDVGDKKFGGSVSLRKELNAPCLTGSQNRLCTVNTLKDKLFEGDSRNDIISTQIINTDEVEEQANFQILKKNEQFKVTQCDNAKVKSLVDIKTDEQNSTLSIKEADSFQDVKEFILISSNDEIKSDLVQTFKAKEMVEENFIKLDEHESDQESSKNGNEDSNVAGGIDQDIIKNDQEDSKEASVVVDQDIIKNDYEIIASDINKELSNKGELEEISSSSAEQMEKTFKKVLISLKRMPALCPLKSHNILESDFCKASARDMQETYISDITAQDHTCSFKNDKLSPRKMKNSRFVKSSPRGITKKRKLKLVESFEAKVSEESKKTQEQEKNLIYSHNDVLSESSCIKSSFDSGKYSNSESSASKKKKWTESFSGENTLNEIDEVNNHEMEAHTFIHEADKVNIQEKESVSLIHVDEVLQKNNNVSFNMIINKQDEIALESCENVEVKATINEVTLSSYQNIVKKANEPAILLASDSVGDRNSKLTDNNDVERCINNLDIIAGKNEINIDLISSQIKVLDKLTCVLEEGKKEQLVKNSEPRFSPTYVIDDAKPGFIRNSLDVEGIQDDNINVNINKLNDRSDTNSQETIIQLNFLEKDNMQTDNQSMINKEQSLIHSNLPQNIKSDQLTDVLENEELISNNRLARTSKKCELIKDAISSAEEEEEDIIVLPVVPSKKEVPFIDLDQTEDEILVDGKTQIDNDSNVCLTYGNKSNILNIEYDDTDNESENESEEFDGCIDISKYLVNYKIDSSELSSKIVEEENTRTKSQPGHKNQEKAIILKSLSYLMEHEGGESEHEEEASNNITLEEHIQMSSASVSDDKQNVNLFKEDNPESSVNLMSKSTDTNNDISICLTSLNPSIKPSVLSSEKSNETSKQLKGDPLIEFSNFKEGTIFNDIESESKFDDKIDGYLKTKSHESISTLSDTCNNKIEVKPNEKLESNICQTFSEDSLTKFIKENRQEENKKDKTITKITLDGLAPSKLDFFSEKTGVDGHYGIYKRIIVIGDHFISKLCSSWPLESKIKPYFLSSDNLSLFQFNHRVPDHPFLKNCDGKILIIAIIGMHDIFKAECIRSSKCHARHSPHRIFGKPFSLAYPNDGPYEYAEEIFKGKIKIESKHRNVYMVYSYIPAVNIVNAGRKLFMKCKNKIEKCTCSYTPTRQESIKIRAESDNLIGTLNQLIFTNRMTQLIGKRFFNYTPLSIEYSNEYWTTRSENKMILNALELEHSLSLVLFNMKSQLKDLYTNSVPETVPNIALTQDKVSVYVIGDSWLKAVFSIWPQESTIKPKFYFDFYMTLAKLKKLILSVSENDPNNTLIITSVCFHDIVEYRSYSGCSDHEPLSFPVPKSKMNDKPISFATDIMKSIIDIESEAYKRRKNLKIVFMTCYPIVLEYYYKSLTEAHEFETRHEILERLVEYKECLSFKDCVKRCLKRINKILIQRNLEINSHTCDIYSLMNQLVKIDKFIIPVFIPNKSPSPFLAEKLTLLLNEYVLSMSVLFEKKKFSFENSIYCETVTEDHVDNDDDEEEIFPHKVHNFIIELKTFDDSRQISPAVTLDPSISNVCKILKEDKESFHASVSVESKEKNDNRCSLPSLTTETNKGIHDHYSKRAREYYHHDLQMNKFADNKSHIKNIEEDLRLEINTSKKRQKENVECDLNINRISYDKKIREKIDGNMYSKQEYNYLVSRITNRYDGDKSSEPHGSNYRSNWYLENKHHRSSKEEKSGSSRYYRSRDDRHSRSHSRDHHIKSKNFKQEGRRSRSRSKRSGHYARSGSRDRWSRSRSRNWRSRSRNRGWKSRSGSRGPRSRSRTRKQRSRSRSREQRYRSRSRSRDQKSVSTSHHLKSKSQTAQNRYSRSRSKDYRSKAYPSDSLKKSDNLSSKDLKKSPNCSKAEESALRNLWEIHNRECDLYRSNPPAHPDYNRLKRMWVDVMISQGSNPYSNSLQSEWESYWLSKMETLFKENWEEKKAQCLSLIRKRRSPLSSDSSTSDSDSSNYSSSKKRHKHKRKKKRSKNLKNSKKPSKREPSLEVVDDRSNNDKKKNVKPLSVTSLAHDLKNAKQLSIEDLESKLNEFMMKSQRVTKVEPKQIYNCDDSRREVTSRISNLEVKLLDVTTILSRLSDRFGALGMSVTVLHDKISHAIDRKENALKLIDDDAKVLFALIKDKLNRIFDEKNLTLVQRAIIQEALDRLTPFLHELESEKIEKPYFGLDLNVIAQVTSGKDVSEVVTFIKNALAYSQICNVSQEELMKIYLAIKDIQIKSLRPNKKFMCESFPSTSKSCQLGLDNKPSRYEHRMPSLPAYTRPNTIAVEAASYMKKTFNYDHVQVPGKAPLTSKTLKIREQFMSLPMNERIKKFSNFNFLPFEEKSFLLTHLEELEKSDKRLAQSLRWMISNNKSFN